MLITKYFSIRHLNSVPLMKETFEGFLSWVDGLEDPDLLWEFSYDSDSLYDTIPLDQLESFLLNNKLINSKVRFSSTICGKIHVYEESTGKPLLDLKF